MNVRLLVGNFLQKFLVEVLLHRHILAQTLSSSGFQKEFPCKLWNCGRLQRPQNDRLVKRITRDLSPVVKARKAKRLTRRVNPQISLEAERLDCREEPMNDIQGSAGLREISTDMTTTPAKDVVDSGNAVRRALNFCEEDRFHQAGACEEEGTVRDAAGSWDDLPTPPLHCLACKYGVDDFELCVPDLFLYQGTFPGGPLETLDNVFLCRIEEIGVHVTRKCVIQKNVGTSGIGTEGPDAACGKDVPFEFLLKVGSPLFFIPIRPDQSLFDLFSDSLFQLLCDHEELVLFVRRLCVASCRA
mmetsp:Transcript_13999/g.27998  ORF Transcript_13999/g.27998 Transcript_13999/m.27998 type:complete len:301 (-) Transcript_13999:2373-3275(-)